MLRGRRMGGMALLVPEVEIGHDEAGEDEGEDDELDRSRGK